MQVTSLKKTWTLVGVLCCLFGFVGCLFMSAVAFSQAEDQGDLQFAPDTDDASDANSDMLYKDGDEAVQEPAQPNPPVQPAPPADQPASPATSQPAAPQDTTPTLQLRASNNTRRDVIFGTYRMRIGAARPDFTELRFYDKLYGQEKLYPTIAGDWFFWDWYATLGFSFRGGYYTANGKAAKEVSRPVARFPDDVTDDDIVKDDASSTTLTLIPLQVAFIAEITPLRQKWLVVDGYIGYESLYWQEVRASRSSKSNAAMIADAEATDDSLTNRGTQNGTVLGFSANILLNGLDGSSANSLRGAMGLGSVYLSPYIEYVKSLSQAPDFSRTTMGIGFTFESIR